MELRERFGESPFKILPPVLAFERAFYFSRALLLQGPVFPPDPCL